MKTILTFLLLTISTFNLFALEVTVGNANADYITDGIDDQVEIQAAIDDVANNGGGTVNLLAQTYTTSSRIIPKSNVALSGMGSNQTIISGTHTFDYVIFNNQAPVDNFHLQNLTIDANNAQNASGVRLNYATNCTIRKVKFIKVTCDGWHLILGIHGDQPEILQADFSRNNLVDNCEFDGHSGSLEMLLIFNTKNSIIQNCIFKNKTRNCPNDGNAPVLGLWQRTDSILIKNCEFLNNESSEAIYYSSSSFNTMITDCSFNNTGSIRGANDSDWEAINDLYPHAKGLKIEGCTFNGGANDRTKMAIQLGGIQTVLIKDCTIEKYEEGITFQGGHTLAGNGHNAPKHWAVINTIIKNSNPNDDVHGLHGGVLFTEGTNLNGFFICGNIFDDQVNPTMRYPLIFEYLNPTIYPTQTYDSIFILGTELSPIAPYNQIQFNHEVNRGADLIFEDCENGSPPSFCDICDTPQSMASYVDLMDNYDVATAQKMADLAALSITPSSCNFDNVAIVLKEEAINGIVTGNTIETNGVVTVNHSSTLKASESIRLTEGFHVQGNTPFLAMIEDCSTATLRETLITNRSLVELKDTNFEDKGEQLELIIYPNPFKLQTTIDYSIPKTTNSSIYLLNALGSHQQILVDNQLLEKGRHQLTLNSEKLNTGTYFLMIQSGEAIETQRLIILK